MNRERGATMESLVPTNRTTIVAGLLKAKPGACEATKVD